MSKCLLIFDCTYCLFTHYLFFHFLYIPWNDKAIPKMFVRSNLLFEYSMYCHESPNDYLNVILVDLINNIIMWRAVDG